MTKKFAPHLTRKHAIATGVTFLVLSSGLAIAAPWKDIAKYGMMAADTNGDGQITKAEMLVQSAARFAAMDKNKDGSLTSADREIAEKQKLDAHFANMDADKNANISRAEFDAAHAKAAAGTAAQSPGLSQDSNGGNDGNDRSDRGKRGDVGWSLAIGRRAAPDMTRTQFQAASQARFDRIDANKDGTVDTAELQAGKRGKRGHKDHGRAGPHGPDAGPAYDPDRSNRDAMSAPVTPPAPGTPTAPVTPPVSGAVPALPAPVTKPQ